MKTVSAIWRDIYGIMDRTGRIPDGVVASLPYSGQAELIEKYIEGKEIKTILEIGAAYGGLANIILKKHPDLEYTIVENKPMMDLTKHNLGRKVKYVEAENIETVGEYDLLICNQCLSEVPAEFAHYILNEIIAKVRYFFIIDDIPTINWIKPDWINIEPYMDYVYPLSIYTGEGKWSKD